MNQEKYNVGYTPQVSWQLAFSWLPTRSSGEVGVWEEGRNQGISPPLSVCLWWAFLTVTSVPIEKLEPFIVVLICTW